MLHRRVRLILPYFRVKHDSERPAWDFSGVGKEEPSESEIELSLWGMQHGLRWVREMKQHKFPPRGDSLFMQYRRSSPHHHL